MSILIRGMELPTSCLECRLYEADIYYCSAADEEIDIPDSSEGRCFFCPLVPVPPHGRLGDLDKLEHMFSDIDSAPYSCFDGTEPFYSAEDAAQIIRLAPTIIEAEREE